MDNKAGIWLEVTEVRFETEEGEDKKSCRVLLKGDRDHPKPVWWPVEPAAVRENAFDTYKAILREMNDKRMVLARLSVKQEADKAWLRCDAFRFQSPELGSR